MNVELITNKERLKEQEKFAARAMLLCHDNTYSLNKTPPKTFLERAIKLEHFTVLEHIVLSFEISDISRDLLQQIARHRLVSICAESTRYCVRKQSCKAFVLEHFKENTNEFLFAMHFVEFAQAHPEMQNDELKRFLPGFWPTNLAITLNARELRHILKLRTAPAAWKEFRELAMKMYKSIPEEYQYLFKDVIGESK